MTYPYDWRTIKSFGLSKGLPMPMPLLLFAFCLAVPGIALANAGLPMLIIAWPLSIVAFLPVVAIESWLVHRDLSIPWKMAAVQMAKANICSSAVGIPIAWFILVVFEMLAAALAMKGFDLRSYPPDGLPDVVKIIMTAPWVGPSKEGAYWIVPLAMMVLLLPFFYASYWLEAWYVGPDLGNNEPKKIRKAIWKANLTTYLLLFLVCLAVLLYGLIKRA